MHDENKNASRSDCICRTQFLEHLCILNNADMDYINYVSQDIEANLHSNFVQKNGEGCHHSIPPPGLHLGHWAVCCGGGGEGLCLPLCLCQCVPGECMREYSAAHIIFL